MARRRDGLEHRPAGEQDVYLYNTYGGPLATITYPTGKTELTTYHYNVLGQKTCQTSVAAFAQNIDCHETKTTKGTARVAGTTSWTYNADGQVITQTNPLTQTATTAADVLHGTGDCTATIAGAAYCTVTTSPSGEVIVTYNDQDGRQVGKVTGYGTSTAVTTKTAYDVKLGNTASCVTGVATATNCTIYTATNSQSTVTYLNAATEAIKTVPPGSNFVTTSTYDATGHVLTAKTNGGTTTDGYNKVGELTSVTYSGTASGYTAPTNVTYTYNADGQQTKMVDGTGTTTTGYNGFGQESSTSTGPPRACTTATTPTAR